MSQEQMESNILHINREMSQMNTVLFLIANHLNIEVDDDGNQINVNSNDTTPNIVTTSSESQGGCMEE
jgi:hypothetical protein